MFWNCIKLELYNKKIDRDRDRKIIVADLVKLADLWFWFPLFNQAVDALPLPTPTRKYVQPAGQLEQTKHQRRGYNSSESDDHQPLKPWLRPAHLIAFAGTPTFQQNLNKPAIFINMAHMHMHMHALETINNPKTVQKLRKMYLPPAP